MIEPSIHEKQVAFLKEHVNEMTEYIKNKNPKGNISYVTYDWISFEIEDSGAFTPKLSVGLSFF